MLAAKFDHIYIRVGGMGEAFKMRRGRALPDVNGVPNPSEQRNAMQDNAMSNAMSTPCKGSARLHD